MSRYRNEQAVGGAAFGALASAIGGVAQARSAQQATDLATHNYNEWLKAKRNSDVHYDMYVEAINKRNELVRKFNAIRALGIEFEAKAAAGAVEIQRLSAERDQLHHGWTQAAAQAQELALERDAAVEQMQHITENRNDLRRKALLEGRRAHVNAMSAAQRRTVARAAIAAADEAIAGVIEASARATEQLLASAAHIVVLPILLRDTGSTQETALTARRFAAGMLFDEGAENAARIHSAVVRLLTVALSGTGNAVTLVAEPSSGDPAVLGRWTLDADTGELIAHVEPPKSLADSPSYLLRLQVEGPDFPAQASLTLSLISNDVAVAASQTDDQRNLLKSVIADDTHAEIRTRVHDDLLFSPTPDAPQSAIPMRQRTGEYRAMWSGKGDTGKISLESALDDAPERASASKDALSENILEMGLRAPAVTRLAETPMQQFRIAQKVIRDLLVTHDIIRPADADPGLTDVQVSAEDHAYLMGRLRERVASSIEYARQLTPRISRTLSAEEEAEEIFPISRG